MWKIFGSNDDDISISDEGKAYFPLHVVNNRHGKNSIEATVMGGDILHLSVTDLDESNSDAAALTWLRGKIGIPDKYRLRSGTIADLEGFFANQNGDIGRLSPSSVGETILKSLYWFKGGDTVTAVTLDDVDAPFFEIEVTGSTKYTLNKVSANTYQLKSGALVTEIAKSVGSYYDIGLRIHS